MGLRLFCAAANAAPIAFAPRDKLLEIGCAQADFKSLALSHQPTLDYRGIDYAKGKGEDVLTIDLPPASFDWVVGVSSIEHVGLGHYSDPLDVDGDVHTMQRVVGWLKPGGSVYLDVPYTPGVYRLYRGTKCRVYDDAAIASRLVVPGLREVWRGYAEKGNTTRLCERPAKDDGNGFVAYVALVLRKG